jgi:flagellar biosynthesis protein FlhG
MQALKASNGRPRIWAIGGGKGGVGKSVVSILLAVELARNNQKTVLVDADLGGANLHTLMGIKSPARTLNDFVTRKYTTIEEICIRTQVSRLELICGASEILSLANPQFAQKSKIVQSIVQISADHVILDLGAGTSFNVLDFFLIADNPIVVLTPQPISIQNAYAFVRNTVYRKLSRMASQQSSLQEVIRTAMDPKNEYKLRTIGDLSETVRKSHGTKTAAQIAEAIAPIRPMIITNMARAERDANAGRIIELVAEKYLTIHSTQLGAISYDPLVEKMISQMMPISDLPKKSRALTGAQAIVRMALNQPCVP